MKPEVTVFLGVLALGLGGVFLSLKIFLTTIVVFLTYHGIKIYRNSEFLIKIQNMKSETFKEVSKFFGHLIQICQDLNLVFKNSTNSTNLLHSCIPLELKKYQRRRRNKSARHSLKELEDLQIY